MGQLTFSNTECQVIFGIRKFYLLYYYYCGHAV